MADPNPAGLNGNSTPAEPHLFQESSKIESTITSVPIDHNNSPGTTASDLNTVGLLEFLETDDRPIFVLDLKSRTTKIPVFQNANLQNLQVIGVRLNPWTAESVLEADPKLAAFLDWAVSSPRETNLQPSAYWGIRWTGRNIRSRWRIITGETGTLPGDKLSPAEQSRRGRTQTTTPERIRPDRIPMKSMTLSEESLDEQLAAFRLHRDEQIPTFPSLAPKESTIREGLSRHDSSDNLGLFDITRPNATVTLSPHIQFFVNFDWGSTELGPVSSWSVELRRMVNLLMSDPRPAAMYWGKQRTTMYNEPYVVATGQRHPGMMGKTFSEAWAEVEEDFVPAFEKAAETGTSFVVDDARFYIERHGYLEECYYSIAIVPFLANDGDIAFYNPVFDTTRQVITDRRMSFLLRLGQYIASSREPKDFWQQLLRGLEVENFDLPFGLLYSAGWDVNETLSVSSEQSQTLKNWVLEGLVRVPGTPSPIPRRHSPDESIEDVLPNFQEMIKSDTPTLLLASDGSMPEYLVQNLKNSGSADVYEAAVFLPIKSTGDTTLGFLILGINPRKRFDDDYRVFIELISRQLATSMAAAVLFEEEIRRGIMAAELAAQDRNLLSKKLAIQRHEASELEERFRRMADLAPVGMFHVDTNGVLIYANNDYYRLTEHPRGEAYPMSWQNVILEDDLPIMNYEWGKLLNGETTSFELRLRKPFIAEEIIGGEEVKGFTWIIAAAYAERAQDGTVVGVLGCITDISRQKWAEGFQKRKMLEAVELKRQQENFIDMTSHEMRNPLSAIIQCADSIGTSLSEFDGGTMDVSMPREILDNYVDAAQTIVLCAQHQKRIIDDILTLSKLDSDLLSITPIEVQPIEVIQNALKMFDSEVQKSDMELRFRVEPSYQEIYVDWVKLDPSRLLQIFINLITNAIKFTQTEARRKIVVSLGASLERPVPANGLQFLPPSLQHKDQTSGYGTGEIVYLSVEVHDSGRGLDENERALLFKRFSQASPRTHVQYGGSGLGLFISRQLTEIQGGQIGVASQSGVGSTFAFYIRTRRCDAPEAIPSSPMLDMKSHARIISSSALEQIQTTPSTTPKSTNLVKHVLIVEDNIVNQKVLSKQLRTAGFLVSVANHGGEALTFLQTTHFFPPNTIPLDIILMDLEMPVMDGLSCVKRIREMEARGEVRGHVPVIAVTANARSEQIAVARERGMDSVVTKPFRIPEVVREMERVLRGREEAEVEVGRSVSAPPF